MGKLEKILLSVLGAVLLLSLALLLWGTREGGRTRVRTVAILMDGGDSGWKNFRRGVEQAASEKNIDVRYVGRYDEEASGEKQLADLDQVLENGADALVILPVDGKALTDRLEELAQTETVPPVVAAGAEVTGGQIDCFVTGDNQALGTMLAKAMYDAGERDCTVFRSAEETEREAQIFWAFTAELEELGMNWRTVILPADRTPSALENTAAAGFSAAMLERMAESLPGSCRIYGAGAGSRIAAYLESGRIRAAAACNEYEMGYLALCAAAEVMDRGTGANEKLDPVIATPENLFDRPWDMVLFPVG